MRLSVVRIVKAKNVRKGNALYVGGWIGEVAVEPRWLRVTDTFDPDYNGRNVRLVWGESLDDWETLDSDERVLVIQ